MKKNIVVLSMVAANALFALDSKPAQNKEVVNVVGVVGEWKGYDDFGGFKLTEADLLKMVENFNALKRDVVVDYEHKTLSGDESPAAGWIKSLIVENGELKAGIAWTDRAKELIEKGEYKYLSPVFVFNSRDKDTGAYVGVTLHSVALTNSPFLDELGEVKANSNKITKQEKEDVASDELAAALVESALLANKLSAKQKDWAFAYCKKDKDGFKAYLDAAEIRTPPHIQNNMFVNKDKVTKEDDEIDVVAAATRKKP
ncbi:MAG: phage protease [Campylobacteraceae bacterium]